jgi:hypothetical protein
VLKFEESGWMNDGTKSPWSHIIDISDFSINDWINEDCWVDAEGHVYMIEDMTPEHKLLALRILERNARFIQRCVLKDIKEMLEESEENTAAVCDGVVGMITLTEELEIIQNTHPDLWITSTCIYRRLMEALKND